MFAVIRETEFMTEVLFKGNQDQCLEFVAMSNFLWLDPDVYIGELK